MLLQRAFYIAVIQVEEIQVILCSFFIQMELLQDETAALNRVLEEQKMVSTSGRKESTESFESFKKDLGIKKEKVEEGKKRLTSVNNILDVMFTEMENLFSLFKRDSPSLIHLLGKSFILYSCMRLKNIYLAFKTIVNICYRNT